MNWKYRKNQTAQSQGIKIPDRTPVMSGECKCLPAQPENKDVTLAVVYKDKLNRPHSTYEGAEESNKRIELDRLIKDTVVILRSKHPWYSYDPYDVDEHLERVLKYKKDYLEFIEKAEKIGLKTTLGL